MKLFELKMSYKEPGFHKPGDPPFRFPPDNVDTKYDANLIEIEGGNGTGKTTLLNCLALALGYLDDKELEKKPLLARKLRRLDENETLSYSFHMRSDKPNYIDLKIERKEGQRQLCLLNSKPIDLDTLRRNFDVFFLTEDDPKKVVSISLGRLAGYFRNTDDKLNTLQQEVTRILMDIHEFQDFKKKEKELIDEIKKSEKRIEKEKANILELKELLQKVQLRDDLENKIDLFADEDRISSRYEALRRKYEELERQEAPSLLRKLKKEKLKLSRINQEIKEYKSRIIQICSSLRQYGVILDSKKILEDDYAEYNQLMENLGDLEEKKAKKKLVDDMIKLFQRYPSNEIVPLINKSIHETLSDLIAIKRRFGDDRVFGLVGTLQNVIKQKKYALLEFDKIQAKIANLSQKIKHLKNFEEIEKKFMEAQKKYFALQKALKENKIKLTTEWQRVRSVKGDAESIKRQIRDIEVNMEADERIKSTYEQKLRILHENISAKPKYLNKKKKLEASNETISRLREYIFAWTRILEQPREMKKHFASVKEGQGFGPSDYNRFVKAVGEYLGKQFEPIDFSYKLHEISFFDIENNTFVTKEDRKIPIDELSRGQSKIATLRKIFKEMDSGKKKIVLIDEIADLDPVNLQYVKDTLKSKYLEGSILLAVLVRPLRKFSSKPVEIRGWG